MKPALYGLLFAFLGLVNLTAADTWVAVGYGGRRMISHDGKTWEISTEWAVNGGDDSNNLISAAYGHGKFVVVGGGGFSKETQGGHILTSTDGKEWKEVHHEPFRVSPIVFNGQRFVAGGPERKLLWSDDGEKWETGAQIAADGFPGWAMWFRQGAYGNGTYVFMGEGGAKKEFFWCITSTDGKTASFRRDLPQLRSLAFGAGLFVAVGNEIVLTSTDGKEWTKQERPGEKLDWILWTGREFLSGGGKTAILSKDGKNWIPTAFKPMGRPLWSDGTHFIGTSWPGKMSYSPDGLQWMKANDLTPDGINSVVKAEEGK